MPKHLTCAAPILFHLIPVKRRMLAPTYIPSPELNWAHQSDGDMLSTLLSIFVFASTSFLSMGLGTLEGKARLARVSGTTAEAREEDHSWLRRKIVFSVRWGVLN